MANWWAYIIVFVLLAALSFFMTPPSWLVNRVVGRFSLHPTLPSEKVTVSVDKREVTGELRDRIVHDFNTAIFLERLDIPPWHESPPPVTIQTERRGKAVMYALYASGSHVDVTRTGLGKPVTYRVDSVALLRHLRLDSAAAAR